MSRKSKKAWLSEREKSGNREESGYCGGIADCPPEVPCFAMDDIWPPGEAPVRFMTEIPRKLACELEGTGHKVVFTKFSIIMHTQNLDTARAKGLEEQLTIK